MQRNFTNTFKTDKMPTVLQKFIFRISLMIVAFVGFKAYSQTLSSQLDKNSLALGEPAVYKIRIDGLGGKDVQSAPKNELLPFHFEEISDNIAKSKDVYERTIEFAVFQEGKFTIPAFDVKIGGVVSKTVPYEIEVVNTAQKDDKISDIMNNKDVKLSVQDYWRLYKWYVLGFLIFIAIIFIIYQVLKYGRKRNSEPVVATNQTLKLLEELRKKNYIPQGNYRAFYVELIDITRDFITKQYGIPADVLLTDDLVDYMKKQNNTISPENERVVEEVFLRGDLVKFAKTFPDEKTMEEDFANVKDFVKRSSRDIEFEKLRKDV